MNVSSARKRPRPRRKKRIRKNRFDIDTDREQDFAMDTHQFTERTTEKDIPTDACFLADIQREEYNTASYDDEYSPINIAKSPNRNTIREGVRCFTPEDRGEPHFVPIHDHHATLAEECFSTFWTSKTAKRARMITFRNYMAGSYQIRTRKESRELAEQRTVTTSSIPGKS